jgi:hypothetical protein
MFLLFPQTHINARFLSHIDNFGLPFDDRQHFVFNKKQGHDDPAFIDPSDPA